MVKLTQDMIETVYRQIETRNHAMNSQAIIHSDELKSILSAQMGVSKDVIYQIVQVLLDSHKVLHIEIISEDESRGTEKIEGYVVTELSLIRNLKNYFEQQLVILYQKTHHQNKGAAGIIKELFTQLQHLKTTELGQILNKTIILGEYEKMLEKDFAQYCHEWQEKRIIELGTEQGFRWRSDLPELNENNKTLSISSHEDEDESLEAESEESSLDLSSQRAVDSDEYDEFTHKQRKLSLQKILSIYGVDFFTKIQFRRYEFLYMKQIIEDGQVPLKSDLTIIKELLARVKDNLYKDAKLQEHRDEIYALDKTITHAMFIAR